MRLLLSRPTYLLSVLWLLCFAVCAGAAWFAAKQPGMGLQLVVKDGEVRVGAVSNVQLSGIPPGAKVSELEAAGMGRIEIKASDLIEDPDFFDTYAEMQSFFDRQTRLSNLLHAHELSVLWQDDKAQQHVSTVIPGPRAPGGLPVVFWFQLFVVASMFMISTAVFAVRPQEWGGRMFALTGVCALISIIPLAIYSSRALALDGDLFRVLSALNHFGAAMYGCALVAMFLLYPRKLVAPHWLWVLPVIYGAIFLGDFLRLFPGQHWGAHYSPLSQVILLALAATWQWRQTRGVPLERYALRWIGLFTLIMCGVQLVAFAMLLQTGFMFVDEGYLTGMFLIMYFGIALGLRKYRLFDMDEWAYRVYLWVGGAAAVILLDLLLIYTGVTESASLGITLLVCGWLYFPFRQWLWQRVVRRHTPGIENLLPALSAIAFSPSRQEQQTRWESLLTGIFEALEMKPTVVPASAGVGEQGLSLHVASCGVLPACTLRHAGNGARLFSSRDAEFVSSLRQLLEQLMSGRSNYELGVAQERMRLGRDLHDNIGARLLKLIHHLRGTPNAEVARDAMKDLRTAIAAIDSQPVPLNNALADWRAEAGSRCEVANCQLQWQQNENIPGIKLCPRSKAMLESVLREIVTNALKHAAPGCIKVEVAADASRLRMSIVNDGNISDPLTWKEGYGLRNMRGRLEEFGGSVHIACAVNEVRLTLEVPLQ